MSLFSGRRQLLRLARWLEADYARRETPVSLVTHPLIERWQSVQRLLRLEARAVRQGYGAAAQRCRQQLSPWLRRFSQDVSSLREDLERAAVPRARPNLKLLYDELAFLFEEFESVQIDWKGKELRVRTEPIVLDEVALGSFDIRLRLHELEEAQPYDVIALQPQPPASTDEITHPHVQSQQLCEGEGRHAIAAALREGRLGEFFVLVRQILRTYNAGSAYHALSDWDDVSCGDCGDSLPEAECSSCAECQGLLCDRCTHCCPDCDESYCCDCSTPCAFCQGRCCESCLSSCQGCEEPSCSGCLQEGLCPLCYRHSLENADADECDAADESPLPPQTGTTEASPLETVPAAAAAVHPHGLGQAAVSA